MSLLTVIPAEALDDLRPEGPVCRNCHDSGWVPIPEDWGYFLHCDCPAGEAEAFFTAPTVGAWSTDGFYPDGDVEPPF